MASFGAGEGGVRTSLDPNKNYTVPLTLMVSLFFMIGFITVMNDVLIPSLKNLFQLEEWQAMLVQSCFFLAYFLMSIPASLIIENVGYKKGLAISLGVIGTGLFMFVPASYLISYPFFLSALFVVGSGLTILQVAINPYIVALGPEETGAARLNFGGALNSFATFIGPIIGGAFVLKHDLPNDIAKAEAVRGPYIVLALVTVGIATILYFLNLPKIESDTEGTEKPNFFEALNFRHLLLGAGGIFFYVGAEVAIGSILILYLENDNLISVDRTLLPVEIQNISITKLASSLLAFYWGSAMIGRLIGSAVAQRIKTEVMLRIVVIVSLILVVVAMSGVLDKIPFNLTIMVLHMEHTFNITFPEIQIPLSVFALILVGLFNSVMWPCIFPLSLKGLGKYTSIGSGLLVMMVVGGAVIPLLQGLLVKFVGYKLSFGLVAFCYAYLLYFALAGYRPKYKNKDIDISNVDLEPTSDSMPTKRESLVS